ncbi:hypothetical protein HUW51_11810 [Adhaeribacter swui]|uniref:Lipocalin family protein n=1 Tax=Adhaeribacter swui TaxID=2086471 RepID=A0A7G7G888_9BACT|nr:hypothetical protein [Adhaeribacter swui]QNF33372.1 hypothetical protein HUW51_11810 [Adhaeribacter swui]
MIRIKAFWVTSILLLLSLTLFGQATRKNLVGEWTTNNKDSLYFKNDTVQLYQDVNYRYGLETCSLIEWKFEPKKFRVLHLFTCSEPGTVNYSSPREKLKLKKRGRQQILEIKKGGLVLDTFLILEFKEYKVQRYPHEIKALKLKRI